MHVRSDRALDTNPQEMELIWATFGKLALRHVFWVCYRVTYVRRPLRYRHLAIHLTVCVRYTSFINATIHDPSLLIDT
jgi:hypothetical protein